MKISTSIFLMVISLGIIQAGFLINSEIVNTITGALSYILIFLVIYVYRKLKVRDDFEYSRLMYLYLVIGIIAILRGLLEAQNYWDWKFLILDTLLILLMPFLSFIASDKTITQAIFYNYIKYLIPVSFVVYFISRNTDSLDGFARFLSPLYVIIIFFPLVTKKWKVIIITLVALSIISALATRSNTIRYSVAILLMLTYYFRFFIHKKLMELARITLFALPLVLFTLAVTDTFNVFKMGENSSDKYVVKINIKGEQEESDLTSDTRTFIYQEVITSSIFRNTWLFGESAVGGYISESFEDTALTSKGRPRSEVGILNIFNYLGIVGTIVFTLIYFFASFLCVNRSNNYICKLIGIFIAFRWTYSWVEEFTNFDMNCFFLWLIIGLCFSRSFRDMTDEEVKYWVLGMFNKKHIENKEYIL